MNTPIIQTERLILRQPTEDDLPNVVKYAGEKSVADGTINIPHPYSEQDAKNWLQLIRNESSKGEQINFGICMPESGLIGSIGLKINPRFDHAETGYWIGAPFRGKGIATEALKAVLTFGFDQLKLHKIYGNHFEANPASARVMVNCGMKKEAVMIDHYKKDGQFLSIVQYCTFRKPTPE